MISCTVLGRCFLAKPLSNWLVHVCACALPFLLKPKKFEISFNSFLDEGHIILFLYIIAMNVFGVHFACVIQLVKYMDMSSQHTFKYCTQFFKSAKSYGLV
ncbi:hypothetical protein R6Q59_002334 [Mikania micrantha]